VAEDPTIDADARDMITEEVQEIVAKIRDLNAQTMKLRAAFRAACGSGVNPDAKAAALALLKRAESAALRWQSRIAELQQKLNAMRTARG
jgi:ribosomal protein L29